MKPIMVADLFCGAGGFSTAVLEALGEDRVKLVALNHWECTRQIGNAVEVNMARALVTALMDTGAAA